MSHSKAITPATPLDIAVIVALAAIWGSVFPAIKVGVAETGPLWLVAIRTGLATMVLVPWVLWRGLALPHGAAQWRLILVLSVCNVALPFMLIAWAQQDIPASVTAVLLGAGPFFALIVGHFTAKDDRINGLKVIAITVGFGGIMLIFWKDLELGGGLLPKLAVLAASLLYVFSGAISRRLSDVPPTRLAFLVFAVNSVVFLPLALVLAPVPTAMSATAIWALLYVGVIPTGLATILRYVMIRRVGLTFYVQGMNLIPVFGVALGLVLVDEPLTLMLVLGLGLILTGLWIARRAAGPSRKTEVI
ncbi:MAG: DMT family transporter [Pseudomonadota bacterium]